MIRKTTLLLFLILSYHFITAQNNISIDIQNESSLSLVGSTNISPFLLIQKGDMLSNKRFNLSVTRNKGKISFSQNQLSVAVLNFSSVNPVAYRDFMRLLKVKRFPELYIQLQYIILHSNSHKVANSANGYAYIAFTITGVTKQYLIPFNSFRDGNTISVDGKYQFSIRDFGLNPPVKLMGLIRTSEMVDIKFHFVVKMNNQDFK